MTTRNNAPLHPPRYQDPPDREKYGPSWTPAYRPIEHPEEDERIFLSADYVHEHKGFSISLSEFGNRVIHAPQGYVLPKELGGVWLGIQDAWRAIDTWLEANSAMDTATRMVKLECLHEIGPEIGLGISEAELEVLRIGDRASKHKEPHHE